MTPREREEAAILARRGYSNQPIENMPSAWDGHRSVRMISEKRKRGLPTTAYSFALTDAEKRAVAQRISALWNLAAAHGWTTEQITNMTALAAQSK